MSDTEMKVSFLLDLLHGAQDDKELGFAILCEIARAVASDSQEK